MICVYPADCTDFSNNGLGTVSPTSCTVTETLNGEWELTLVHPIDERDKWRKLTDGGILRVPVPAAMTPQINLVTQQYQTILLPLLVENIAISPRIINSMTEQEKKQLLLIFHIETMSMYYQYGFSISKWADQVSYNIFGGITAGGN